jgi:hypothetical protein
MRLEREAIMAEGPPKPTMGSATGKPPVPDPGMIRLRQMRDGLKRWVRTAGRAMRESYYQQEMTAHAMRKRLQHDPRAGKHGTFSQRPCTGTRRSNTSWTRSSGARRIKSNFSCLRRRPDDGNGGKRSICKS